MNYFYRKKLTKKVQKIAIYMNFMSKINNNHNFFQKLNDSHKKLSENHIIQILNI